MKTVLELVAEIVSAHASNTTLTTDQLVQELQIVHATLKNLEEGATPAETPQTAQDEVKESRLTIRQAFKRDEVVCMECQRGGFKTLKKHLSSAHQLTPGQYRKKFGIKSTQKLAAKNFSDARRQAAEERGMGDVLAKAREKRMANLNASRAQAVKAAKTAKPVKAPAKAAAAKAKK